MFAPPNPNIDRSLKRVHCVYCLRCPVSRKIVYVGKTKDAFLRLTNYYTSKANNLANNWFRDTLKSGQIPIFEILETLSKELNKGISNSERERYWITFYFSKNPDLLNIVHNPKYKTASKQNSLSVSMNYFKLNNYN